jgi:hypothetical protein
MSASERLELESEYAMRLMDIDTARLLFREKILAMDKDWRPATKQTRLTGLQAR